MDKEKDATKNSTELPLNAKGAVEAVEPDEPILSGSARVVAAIMEAENAVRTGVESDAGETEPLEEEISELDENGLPEGLQPGARATDTYAEASEVVLPEPVKAAPRRSASRRGGAPLGEGVTVDELLTTELASRAAEANPQLRTHLTGKFIIEIRDTGDRYLFNWSNDTPVLGKTDESSGDCVISLDGASVLSIAEGRLNPQIAMLSHKIRVTGRLVLAMYFFNLLHPNGFGQSLA